jgi:K+-sensing histidine kinase KdpD
MISPLLKKPKLFPIYWVILALIVLACDYTMGPFIQFPFLFILPVVLASWYNGLWWGLVYALSLPLARLYFSTFWITPWTPLDVGINAVIRISVLLLIAFLVDHAAVQNKALTKEVHMLQGLLPICSFCKKIRNGDNTWEQLEYYISKHSEAQFSHGMCPDCAAEIMLSTSRDEKL